MCSNRRPAPQEGGLNRHGVEYAAGVPASWDRALVSPPRDAGPIYADLVDAVTVLQHTGGVNGAKIGAVGFSNGGYFALWLAATSKVQARVSYYGALSGAGTDKSLARFAQVFTASSSPVLILHGTADDTVPVAAAREHFGRDGQSIPDPDLRGRRPPLRTGPCLGGRSERRHGRVAENALVLGRIPEAVGGAPGPPSLNDGFCTPPLGTRSATPSITHRPVVSWAGTNRARSPSRGLKIVIGRAECVARNARVAEARAAPPVDGRTSWQQVLDLEQRAQLRQFPGGRDRRHRRHAGEPPDPWADHR